MRITDSMRLSTALLSETRSAANVYKLTEESASGSVLQAPSDDPTGFASLVSMDARLTVMQGRSQAASTAASDLDTASGALSSAGDILEQAKQIALEGANGTSTAADRAASGAQVTALVSQMIQLGNTKGSNGYLFGGSKTDTPPFDAAGNFTGNGTVNQIEVADGLLATSGVSGAQAFTATGGSNVIADLQSLATALTSNNGAGISSAITQMDADQQQVLGVEADAGALSDNLTATGEVLTSSITATQTARSTLDNAGTPTVYSELQAAQSSYQAAISVTQEVLSLSSFEASAA